MNIIEQVKFKRYDSPEQYTEAFLQMIDARERFTHQEVNRTWTCKENLRESNTTAL